MMGGYGSYGMGWFGGIFMIAFWVLVIAGVVFLARWLVVSSRKRERGSGGDSPLETLKSRYARGEINKEEFEEKKKDLL
jgi:putative membrane protein